MIVSKNKLPTFFLSSRCSLFTVHCHLIFVQTVETDNVTAILISPDILCHDTFEHFSLRLFVLNIPVESVNFYQGELFSKHISVNIYLSEKMKPNSLSSEQ